MLQREFSSYTAGNDDISTGSGAENQKYWTKLVNSQEKLESKSASLLAC